MFGLQSVAVHAEVSRQKPHLQSLQSKMLCQVRDEKFGLAVCQQHVGSHEALGASEAGQSALQQRFRGLAAEWFELAKG